MRVFLAFIMAIVTCCSGVLFVGCGGHSHSFTLKQEDVRYLKAEATCEAPAQYYYSCECGESGTDTFTVGTIRSHDYSAEIVEEKYIKDRANCISPATYYKSCTMCGQKGYYFLTFEYGEAGTCDYSKEVAEWQYLKDEATKETSAVYYKSCICGAKARKETFSYGDKLKEYTVEEKISYTPTSLTVSLYDAENSVYGFTWNTQNEPLRPVIQFQKGNALTENCEEISATATKASSYNENDEAISYYIIKAEVQLDALETYTYRAYDKYVDVATDSVTLQTKNTKSDSFTFAHVSDSQTEATEATGEGTGAYFGKTLSQIVGNNDFILHTGDVVEWAKYEGYWKAMLHDNFSYLSQIPMMAISGNHETTYRNGTNETFKHFHNKLPTQQSTNLGYFYSFVYGNAKFIMLNTNDLTDNKLKTEQYDWLVNELKNNTCTWTIVSMHNPMYSVGKWGADNSRNGIAMALRTQLQGMFAEYGVDVVLQGHDHEISRTYPIDGNGKPQTETWQTVDGVEYSVDPSGVIYVMNGPAGNQSRGLYAVDNSLYKYAEGSKVCSWAEFSIDDNSMKVTVKYYTGTETKIYHSWGIAKS